MATISSHSLSPLDFYDLDTSDKDWSIILWNGPRFRFVWDFLLIRLRLCILCKNSTEAIYCPYCIMSHGVRCQYVLFLMLLTFIAWLRWCLQDFFLYYKVAILLFTINKYFVSTLRLRILFLLK